jgi:hypothetical protein
MPYRMMRLIIAILYNRFYLKEQAGKRVIPWFHTCFALSLVGTCTVAGALKLIMDYTHHGYYPIRMTEDQGILFLLSLMLAIFFTVKYAYFNTGKHIRYYEWFQVKDYDSQFSLSIWVRFALIAVPAILCITAGINQYLYQKP